MKVACIVPTYNGKAEFERLLDSLDRQKSELELFVVDSSSVDGTYELALSRCDNVVSIPSVEFNHGGTRQLMVDKNPSFDIYVFLTQDAYLEDPQAIAKLLMPFNDPDVGAVCGRQIPHLDASPIAQHARLFNYPKENLIKTMQDSSVFGIKTAFMSNSFAAYRADCLREIGGFPTHVIFAEDMYVAAKMLLAGFKVAYSGEAACRHSHNYTITEEFRRYFDMGVFHAREEWIRKEFGGAGGEGVKFVKSELKFLGFSKFYQWPGVIVRNAMKLCAYKLGQNERFFCPTLKKSLGMYKGYWDGPNAR